MLALLSQGQVASGEWSMKSSSSRSRQTLDRPIRESLAKFGDFGYGW